MGDNAPNSVNRPPWPNLVNLLTPGRRVEQHIATVLITAGVPSVVTTLSSPGIAVTDAGTGRVGVTFPAGGTGAIGWVVDCAPSFTAPNTAFATGGGVLMLDSDLTNFVTGTLEVTTKDAAGADADLQTLATFTLVIHVIKAPA